MYWLKQLRIPWLNAHSSKWRETTAFEPSGPWRRLGVFLLDPPDGMVAHCRVTPPPPKHHHHPPPRTPHQIRRYTINTWVERGTVKARVLPKNTTRTARSGVSPLTMKPPSLLFQDWNVTFLYICITLWKHVQVFTQSENLHSLLVCFQGKMFNVLFEMCSKHET